jgi:hypothetical protein
VAQAGGRQTTLKTDGGRQTTEKTYVGASLLWEENHVKNQRGGFCPQGLFDMIPPRGTVRELPIHGMLNAYHQNSKIYFSAANIIIFIYILSDRFVF